LGILRQALRQLDRRAIARIVAHQYCQIIVLRRSPLLRRRNNPIGGLRRRNDSAARELRYSAAGHPPMLLLRDGKVKEVAENGLMLAGL